MAAALLNERLPRTNIVSAGLGALVGRPAEPEAAALLAARGLDVSTHRSQQLTELLCKQANLILVMERGHKDQLERHYPFTRGKVFRLGDHGGYDIFDPFRQGRERFEACYELIDASVQRWAQSVMRLA
ncbi:protein-tyrosine phosphatase [Paraburkholderia sp. Clong3]